MRMRYSVRGLLHAISIRLELSVLRLFTPSHLARIAREHHIETVRQRAWVLSGAFDVGQDCYFNWGISVVVHSWGQLAAKCGDRVAIAPGAYFISASGPCYSRLAEIEGFAARYIKYQPITVGDDSWIGAGAIIMPGVRIGRFCLVGAGAVVTKDVPDYAVVAGVPARVVGDVRGERRARCNASLSA